MEDFPISRALYGAKTTLSADIFKKLIEISGLEDVEVQKHLQEATARQEEVDKRKREHR